MGEAERPHTFFFLIDCDISILSSLVAIFGLTQNSVGCFRLVTDNAPWGARAWHAVASWGSEEDPPIDVVTVLSYMR